MVKSVGFTFFLTRTKFNWIATYNRICKSVTAIWHQNQAAHSRPTQQYCRRLPGIVVRPSSSSV